MSQFREMEDRLPKLMQRFEGRLAALKQPLKTLQDTVAALDK
jgi:hypothetical protein